MFYCLYELGGFETIQNLQLYDVVSLRIQKIGKQRLAFFSPTEKLGEIHKKGRDWLTILPNSNTTILTTFRNAIKDLIITYYR